MHHSFCIDYLNQQQPTSVLRFNPLLHRPNKTHPLQWRLLSTESDIYIRQNGVIYVCSCSGKPYGVHYHQKERSTMSELKAHRLRLFFTNKSVVLSSSALVAIPIPRFAWRCLSLNFRTQRSLRLPLLAELMRYLQNVRLPYLCGNIKDFFHGIIYSWF